MSYADVMECFRGLHGTAVVAADERDAIMLIDSGAIVWGSETYMNGEVLHIQYPGSSARTIRAYELLPVLFANHARIEKMQDDLPDSVRKDIGKQSETDIYRRLEAHFQSKTGVYD